MIWKWEKSLSPYCKHQCLLSAYSSPPWVCFLFSQGCVHRVFELAWQRDLFGVTLPGEIQRERCQLCLCCRLSAEPLSFSLERRDKAMSSQYMCRFEMCLVFCSHFVVSVMCLQNVQTLNVVKLLRTLFFSSCPPSHSLCCLLFLCGLADSPSFITGFFLTHYHHGNCTVVHFVAPSPSSQDTHTHITNKLLSFNLIPLLAFLC